MNQQRLMNALRDMGANIKPTKHGYRAICGDFEVSWHEKIPSSGPNSVGAKAEHIHCGRISDPWDHLSDYHPGFFPKTIKAAVAHLKEGKTEILDDRAGINLDKTFA